MKKIVLLAGLIVILLVVGCEVEEAPMEQITKEKTSQEPKEEVKDPEITEVKGITVDRLIFQEGEIRKNKFKKTAEMELNIPLEEEGFVLGTEFTTQIMCGILSMFFNQSAIEEWNNAIEELNREMGVVNEEKKEELEEKEEVIDLVEGYELTTIYLALINNKTKEKISDCTITGYGEEDIKINIYKEYEVNLFGE